MPENYIRTQWQLCRTNLFFIYSGGSTGTVRRGRMLRSTTSAITGTNSSLANLNNNNDNAAESGYEQQLTQADGSMRRKRLVTVSSNFNENEGQQMTNCSREMNQPYEHMWSAADDECCVVGRCSWRTRLILTVAFKLDFKMLNRLGLVSWFHSYSGRLLVYWYTLAIVLFHIHT